MTAVRIGGRIYCMDCRDTESDLAQAEAEPVDDTELYDVDQGEVTWVLCARCGSRVWREP